MMMRAENFFILRRKPVEVINENQLRRSCFKLGLKEPVRFITGKKTEAGIETGHDSIGVVGIDVVGLANLF